MNLLTIDVETTMNAPGELDKSHPMHPKNDVVLIGGHLTFENTSASITNIYNKTETIGLKTVLDVYDIDFVVGCNISFDLLYLYRCCNLKNELQEKRLWDIQLAEYLITGQQSKWPSLDSMCTKYGLPLKDSKVTDYFAKGYGADLIPVDMLSDYLEADLTNTAAIAKIQMQEAAKLEQFPLIISQMEALHATTEMMYNGLFIDKEYFKNYAGEVAKSYSDTKDNIEKVVKLRIAEDDTLYPIEDIDSSLQWSKFLFGGKKKVSKIEVVGMYKNGKPKTKKVIEEVETKAVCDVAPKDEWKSEKTGKVSVDEKVLTYIKDNTKDIKVNIYMQSLLQYRELAKQLNTYVLGLAKHTIPNIHTDSEHIHGRLNHVATSTGRLSSTSPNLQNISNNPIKKIFTSRWPNGCLVEFDFQQLEVAVLAHITNDKQLITDISTGKDIHTELYKDMFHVEPTKEERKWFKRLTFGLIYGAGPKTLADNAGCDIDTSKLFVDTFYKRYPGVKTWNEEISLDADKYGVHDEATAGYEFSKTWHHKSETGRIYVFKQYKNKYADSVWSTAKSEYTYSPTELKNYPVQGLATGDIVPMMLGILYRKFKNYEGIKLVNTVHDSILFDVADTEDKLNNFIKEVFNVLNNTHVYFEKTFGNPLALKLSAGCSVGKNWFEMKELDK